MDLDTAPTHPPGWFGTTLGEVCSKPQYGWTTKAKNGEGVRLLRTTDISSGSIDWDRVPACSEIPKLLASYLLAENDIVISRAGSVGLSYLLKCVPSQSVFASYLIRFRPNLNINSRFIAFYLQSPAYWRMVREASVGIALANVNASKLEAFSLPLAPLLEQHRIVAEIERQFSLLDAGVANLKRVQANLKRYRASVLQAACTGQLVPTEAQLAQAEGRAYEPADVLLTRILAERRARWEAEQLAKMEVQGKLPLNGAWKAKYQEPATPDMIGLPELPEGWAWASLSMMTSNIGDVDHKMPKAVPKGIPYVSTKDFGGQNDIDFDRAKRISPEDYFALCRKIKPTCGDLLLSRYGTVGEVRYVRTEQPFQASYSVAILKMITSHTTTEYILTLMRSSVVQTQVKRDIRATAQPDLGLDHIRKFVVSIPPLAEQERIVGEVERRLSVVDNLEQVVKANLKRAERLRQAILKEAFAGRLVPQDPADEPAGVLLERIKAEQEAQAAAKTGRRKERPDASPGHNDVAGTAVPSGHARRKRGIADKARLQPDLFSPDDR